MLRFISQPVEIGPSFGFSIFSSGVIKFNDLSLPLIAPFESIVAVADKDSSNE